MIIAIAAVMVVSLIVVYCKQKISAVKGKKSRKAQNQESLLTVEERYKDEYINRTSVDPESQRGTVDYGLSDSLLGKEKTEDNLQQPLSEPVADETNEQ